ncbi:hypothetical protein [Thermococcus prieurii]
MIDISVNVPLYQGLSLRDIIATLVLLSIPKILEFILDMFKRNNEPTNQKKIQNVIVTNVHIFQELNQNINKIKRNTMYYLGKNPTIKDELLDLAIFLGFSIVAIYVLPMLNEFIIRIGLEHYLSQNSNLSHIDYLVFIFNDVVNIFLLIFFVALLLISHRRAIVASIFYNYPHNLFPLISTEGQFRKLRIYSYLVLFVNILGAIQLLVILFVGDAVIKAASVNDESHLDLIWSVILVVFIIVLWVLIFRTSEQMISHRILTNRLVTLLEIRKLPYAKLSLSNGDSVEGLIFNPFTDKTYLVMIDPEDSTTKFFIPWKHIEWLKFKDFL